MKLFIIGLPKSGRTTVAKKLADSIEYDYVQYAEQISSSFRSRGEGEHIQQYLEQYHIYLTSQFRLDPSRCIKEVNDKINKSKYKNQIIDGVFSPRDFAHLFDYNEDIVIFLNRTDNEIEYRDSDNIGVSVIRDYCFWMSSSGLIDKSNWIEYNFKIPGEDNDFTKELGSKNSVFIVRSLNKVISHIESKLI